MTLPFNIHALSTPADLEATKELFKAYTTSLGRDLTFQNYENELSSLPGKYAPPKGALLLAYSPTGVVLGCVALRSMTAHGICEMKRLYVAPEGRGLGLGKALIQAVISEARNIGYRAMRLDTLPTMGAAIDLYKKVGFVPIPAYYETPLEDTLFLELQLVLCDGNGKA